MFGQRCILVFFPVSNIFCCMALEVIGNVLLTNTELTYKKYTAWFQFIGEYTQKHLKGSDTLCCQGSHALSVIIVFINARLLPEMERSWFNLLNLTGSSLKFSYEVQQPTEIIDQCGSSCQYRSMTAWRSNWQTEKCSLSKHLGLSHVLFAWELKTVFLSLQTNQILQITK